MRTSLLILILTITGACTSSSNPPPAPEDSAPAEAPPAAPTPAAPPIEHPIQYSEVIGRYVEAACTRIGECKGTEAIDLCWFKVMARVCTTVDCTRIVDYDLGSQQWSECLRETSEGPCENLQTPPVCDLP